jgi:hypothetical protein
MSYDPAHYFGQTLLGGFLAPPPPPPGYDGVGWGVPKFVKRAGKGVASAAKKTARGSTSLAKRAATPAKFVAKAAVTPMLVAAKAGKAAMKAAATLAAVPIKKMFQSFAGRRARLLAYQNRKSLVPNSFEKGQATAWSLSKLNGSGPIGKLGVKILKFTGGSTLGANLAAAADVGMTGVEVAAAAAAIISAMKTTMSAFNKPGEAPADPTRETAPATTAVAQQIAHETNELLDPSDDGDSTDGFFGPCLPPPQ